MKLKRNMKRSNLVNFFTGDFFLALSGILASFFLPFYLKEKGLGILEIGFLFTLGLAFGHLITSIFYSSILKKTKLKSGLIFSSIFGAISNFVLFFFPSSSGVFISKLSEKIKNPVYRISSDIVMQHNSSKKEHRDTSSMNLITNTLGYVVGLVVSVLFIFWIGYKFSFLIFALFTLPSFLFFNRIQDGSRLVKKKTKLLKIPRKLKLILFSEIIYWFALASSFALIVTFLIADRFEGSIVWLAILFGGLYLSIVFTTLFTKRFLNKFDLIKTSILGMILLMLSAILVIISTNLYFVLGAFILEGIGAGIWVPSKTAIYWKFVKKENREKVSGYLGGWRGFVNILGPLFGGFLVVKLGILAPFYFKVIISFSILLIYLYLRER